MVKEYCALKMITYLHFFPPKKCKPFFGTLQEKEKTANHTIILTSLIAYIKTSHLLFRSICVVTISLFSFFAQIFKMSAEKGYN